MLYRESIEVLLLKFSLLANLNWVFKCHVSATKNLFIKKYQFPNWDQLVGDILGKLAKNFIKIVKSVFFDQNSGGGGTSKILRQDKTNFCSVGGGPSSPPIRGNPEYSDSIFADIIATLLISSTFKEY